MNEETTFLTLPISPNGAVDPGSVGRRPAVFGGPPNTPQRLVRAQGRGRMSSPGRRRLHAGRVRSPFNRIFSDTNEFVSWLMATR